MALYFEERGNHSGPTIVFIHGGAGLSSWMWEKQAEYFRDYHCLILDLPEHGRSTREGRISVPDSASQIAGIIEKHANGRKANVIGYSFGSKVIVELLNTRPELIDHAIVASALLRPVPLMLLSNKRSFAGIITSLLKYRPVAGLLINYLDFPDRTYKVNCMKELRGLTVSKLYRVFNELYQNLRLPKGLDNVKVPTLIIAGEKESSAMKQSVVDMVKAMPNAEGILIKNGPHTYPWSMHDQFNRIVEKWINDEEIPSELAIRLTRRPS